METKRLSGRTVLFALVGFFGVVIGMNALMASLAIGTFDGAVEDDAYRSGLDFNARIAAARAQEDVGWSAASTLTPDREIEVFLKDAQSSPLSQAQLTGLLWRQTARNMDAPLSFQEREPGQYVARIPVQTDGRYELRFTVRSAQKDVAFKRSIHIEPTS